MAVRNIRSEEYRRKRRKKRICVKQIGAFAKESVEQKLSRTRETAHPGAAALSAHDKAGGRFWWAERV